jgi:hypothetical protein
MQQSVENQLLYFVVEGQAILFCLGGGLFEPRSRSRQDRLVFGFNASASVGNESTSVA